jgi:hypothetical protein
MISLNILNLLHLKLVELIENLKINSSLKKYKKSYLHYLKQSNKTYLYSKKHKLKLFCVSSNSLDIIKLFILYHFKIGFDEINIKTPHKSINFSKAELKWIKKKKKIVNLYNFDFKNFDQSKMINKFFKKNLEKSINFILDGDEFIFTNKKINLDLYNLIKNNYSCCQVNFYNKYNSPKNMENSIMRSEDYFSEKKLIFEKDYLKINKLVSIKTLFFINDNNLSITKGNHKILNKKKTKYLDDFYLLHAKLISFEDIKLRVKFELNRKKNRKNKLESLTSKIFHKEITKKEINNIWSLNTYKSLKDKSKILDYSLRNILNTKIF